MPRGVLDNIHLGAYTELTWEHHQSLLGSISQAGRESAIESNWEHTVKQAGSVQSSTIRNVHHSVLGSIK